MAVWSKLGVSGPAAAAGCAVALVLVVGVYVAYSSLPAPQETRVDEGDQVVVATPEPAPLVSEALPESAVAEPEQTEVLEPEVVEVAPEPKAVATPDQDVTQTASPEPDRPAFDVVQVQPDGGGVLAGRAVPGRPVIFYLDGAEFARAIADRAGKFGLVLDFPSSEQPRALSMASVLEDGRELASVGTLLISPVRAAAPEAALDAKPEPDVAQLEAPSEPATEPSAKQQDAPAVVLATNEGVQVLQAAPQPAAPQIDDAPEVANVVIDTITYDTTGDVALSGRGAKEGFVRVYLDGKPVKTAQIAEDGSWRAPLPDVDAGVYRLRVDEVDAEGAVTSRVETPFQREEPDVVAQAPTGPAVVTVQPGFTLWAIARDKFGSGEQYVRVYEANRDLIRDPDLIYPGQVFAIPEG